MNVLVKYPTRARPHLFQIVATLYLADPTASLLVSIDADDATMNNPAMLAWMDAQPRLTYRVGNSRSKVEAINDGLNDTAWDGLLILASDDMIPQRPDYAARIAEIFNERFPLGDGVLHLNDGRVGRQLNTLCILDRKYFERFGYVYSPHYAALWCDNEFQEVSELLGRAAYVDEVIIRHDWIGENGAGDELLRRNEAFNDADAATFSRRQAAGFPA